MQDSIAAEGLSAASYPLTVKMRQYLDTERAVSTRRLQKRKGPGTPL
jgi:hypothetical protein